LALGETEIVGQVRSAWQSAAGAGLAPELNQLFAGAIDAARRIRRQSAFGRHPSVAAMGVQAAAETLGGLTGRRAAVVGAGATGKAAAAALLAAGAAQLTMLNRSLQRAAAAAEWLSAPQRVVAASLDALPQALAEVEVLVSATASSAFVIPASVVAAAVSRRRTPLMLVDIAVPRDVDPAVRGLKGVQLMDLDDLEARCAVDASSRQREIERVEGQAAAAAAAWVRAVQQRASIPDVVALRRRVEAIRRDELRRIAPRLAGLSPQERQVVEETTYRLVQKLLHQPSVSLRQMTNARHRGALLKMIAPPETHR
jgi:glutamyl-tRNA reductase